MLIRLSQHGAMRWDGKQRVAQRVVLAENNRISKKAVANATAVQGTFGAPKETTAAASLPHSKKGNGEIDRRDRSAHYQFA